MGSKGFTLIEVLVSMLIFAVGLSGSMALFHHLKEVSIKSCHEKMAAQLASSKMEELKVSMPAEGAYADESFSIGTFSAQRSWSVGPTLGTGYKEVHVVVNWTEAGRTHPETVDLATFIAL